MKKITKAVLFAGAVAAVAGAFTGCVNDVEAEKTYVEIEAPKVTGVKAQSIEKGRALLVTWTPTNTAFSAAIVSPLGYTKTFDVAVADAKRGYKVIKVDDTFSLKQDEIYTLVATRNGSSFNHNDGGNTFVNELEGVTKYTYKSDVTSPEAASKLDPYTADDVKVYLKEDNSKYAMVFNGSNTHELYGQSYEIFIAGTDYRVATSAPSQFTTAEFPYIGSSVDVKIKKTWTGNIGRSDVKYYQDSDEYVVTLTRAEDPAGEGADVSGFTATASTDRKNVEIGWSTTSDVNKVSFKIYKAEADAEGKLVGAVTEVASVGAERLISADGRNNGTYAYKDTLGSGKKYKYYIVAYNSKGNAKAWATAAEVDGNYQAGTKGTLRIVNPENMITGNLINDNKIALSWTGDKYTNYLLYYTTIDLRGNESAKTEIKNISYDEEKNEFACNTAIDRQPATRTTTRTIKFYLESQKDGIIGVDSTATYTYASQYLAAATISGKTWSNTGLTLTGDQLNLIALPDHIYAKIKYNTNSNVWRKIAINSWTSGDLTRVAIFGEAFTTGDELRIVIPTAAFATVPPEADEDGNVEYRWTIR